MSTLSFTVKDNGDGTFCVESDHGQHHTKASLGDAVGIFADQLLAMKQAGEIEPS